MSYLSRYCYKFWLSLAVGNVLENASSRRTHVWVWGWGWVFHSSIVPKSLTLGELDDNEREMLC